MLSSPAIARTTFALALVTLGAGCSSATPPPRIVRATEPSGLAGVDLTKESVVLEFLPGDVIPLTLVIDGDVVGTPKDAPPIPLTAKSHFFLKVGPGVLAVSLDAAHWETKPIAPGRFQIGIGVDRAGPRASISLTTPKHAAPERAP